MWPTVMEEAGGSAVSTTSVDTRPWSISVVPTLYYRPSNAYNEEKGQRLQVLFSRTLYFGPNESTKSFSRRFAIEQNRPYSNI